jgi:hypothetical protein
MRTLSTRHPAWPDTAILDLDQAVDDLDAALQFVASLPARDQALQFTRPVRLAEDTAHDAAVLQILASAVAAFVPVNWVLTGLLPWSLRTVVHLPPPRNAPDADAVAGEWQRRVKFGLCAWRRGPGFVSIYDVRPNGTKYSLKAPDGPFLAITSSRETPPPGAAADLLEELAGLDLVLRLDRANTVLLPYHAYRWPVPGRVGSTARTGYSG